MAARVFHTTILPVRLKIQEKPYSCGAASLKIVLEMLGKEISEAWLMRVCKTDPEECTTAQRLKRALKKLKVKFEEIVPATIQDIEENVRSFRLCLVAYQAWARGGSELEAMEGGHYSIIFGFNETHFFIADPNKRRGRVHRVWGVRTMGKGLFRTRWRDKDSDKDGVLRRWLIAVPLAQPNGVKRR